MGVLHNMVLYNSGVAQLRYCTIEVLHNCCTTEGVAKLWLHNWGVAQLAAFLNWGYAQLGYCTIVVLHNCCKLRVLHNCSFTIVAL